MANYEHGMQKPPSMEDLKTELERVEQLQNEKKPRTQEESAYLDGIEATLLWAVGIRISKPSE